MDCDQANHALSLKGSNHLKAAVLLAVCFFLISAPAPDANVIADINPNMIPNTQTHASELKFPFS